MKYFLEQKSKAIEISFIEICKFYFHFYVISLCFHFSCTYACTTTTITTIFFVIFKHLFVATVIMTVYISGIIFFLLLYYYFTTSILSLPSCHPFLHCSFSFTLFCHFLFSSDFFSSSFVSQSVFYFLIISVPNKAIKLLRHY